jgi:glycosyltransferase involved in cell wall biosynthesis
MPPITVTIDYTPAIQQHAGIGRYADELTRAVLALDTGDALRLFYVDPQGRAPAAPLDQLPRRMLRQANKSWRLRVLMASFARRPMDEAVGAAGGIFHATDHLLPPFRRVRSVFTLYDLTFLKFPEAHLPLNRWYSRLMAPRGLRASTAVIAISDSTKRDAVAAYGLPADHIQVIPLGVDARFRPVDSVAAEGIRSRYRLPDRFLLAVGTIEPRKNLITLLNVYHSLVDAVPDVKLVIVGKRGWRADAFYDRIRELGLGDRVILPGFVPDDDLPAIYSCAEALAFPSIYEGFGLPVLEAMACGTPVVCSNTSSMPEVAGQAAVLLAPDDVRGWTLALHQIVTDAPFRFDLRQRGLARAARFTWESTARQTQAVYEEVYARRP